MSTNMSDPKEPRTGRNPVEDGPINPQCSAFPQEQTPCKTGSFTMRKIVSHIFGRNMSCTSQIPKDCHVTWCRKHYQRLRHRMLGNGWIYIQIECVRTQLHRMQEWGGVSSWNVTLQRRNRIRLHAEDAVVNSVHGAGVEAGETFAADNNTESGGDRFLVPFLGIGKSFDDIFAIVNAIELKANEDGLEEFPPIQFLPMIDPIKYPRSAARRGGKKTTGEVKDSARPKSQSSLKKTSVYNNERYPYQDNVVDEENPAWSTNKPKERKAKLSEPTPTSSSAVSNKKKPAKVAVKERSAVDAVDEEDSYLEDPASAQITSGWASVNGHKVNKTRTSTALATSPSSSPIKSNSKEQDGAKTRKRSAAKGFGGQKPYPEDPTRTRIFNDWASINGHKAKTSKASSEALPATTPSPISHIDHNQELAQVGTKRRYIANAIVDEEESRNTSKETQATSTQWTSVANGKTIAANESSEALPTSSSPASKKNTEEESAQVGAKQPSAAQDAAFYQGDATAPMETDVDYLLYFAAKAFEQQSNGHSDGENAMLAMTEAEGAETSWFKRRRLHTGSRAKSI